MPAQIPAVAGPATSVEYIDEARRQEELLRTGALQSAIFNSAYFSSIATDAKGVIQIFNVGAARMLGYSAANVMNKITPADISDPQELIERAHKLSIEFDIPIAPGFDALVFKASRGIEDIYELTYIRKDGSRFPAVVSVTALRDEGNTIIGYLLIGTDNTARKQAEEALRRAGALQNAIFNSANFSSIATDAKGVIQIFNVGAERMLGYTAAEVTNKITPADISDPLEVIDRAKALSTELGTDITPGFEALVFKASRGIEDIYELTYIRKDGSRFPAVVSVTALRDEANAIIGYLLIGTDNTARKQVEAEQRKLDQRLRDQQFYTRSLIESNIDALMTTDPAGIISDVNKQMELLTGCTRDELIGAPFKNFFTDPNRAEAGIRRVLNENKVTNYELTARARNGKETVVSYNATTFHDRDRTLQGVFAAARDVTEHQLLDRELRETNIALESAKSAAEKANLAKSDFLSNMSHEIRTPLNAVIGVTHLLADSNLDHDQRQLVSKAQMAGRSLLGIINDVLDLAKIEAGEMALDEAIFLPAELLYELEAVYGAQVRAKGLSFHVHSAADVPHGLVGDSGRLRQILTNLIGNALKFTVEGGVEVRVSVTSRLDNRLVLHASVRDTGIGIDPEVQARLFQPFTQADVSTTRHFGGTGLGLSIVRRLSQLMGGEVGLNSSPGHGSDFWVQVPMSVPSAEQTASFASAKLEVVLVDDNHDDRRALAAMARALGWRPTLLDSRDMVRQIQRRAEAGEALPGVVIVDCEMPDMDRLQALQGLTGPFSQGRLPVVLMIAAHERKTVADLCRDHNLDYLADHMLSKPIGNSDLFNAVNAAIAQRGGSMAALALSLHPGAAGGRGGLAHVNVLVVDDSDINLDIARRLLERQGAKVQTCSNGQMAVDMLRRDGSGWDLVLMDVQMPIMDGLEATRRIRGELGLTSLPIVALTAGALSEERKRAMAAGVDEFLSKPLDPQAMVDIIRKLVERRRGHALSAAPAEQAAPIAEKQFAWPEVAGIDISVAERNLGGDWALFVSILQRLLSEYQDLITVPLIEPEGIHREGLVARMHKLSGSAGTVGATEIHRLSAKLEGALQTPGLQALGGLQALSRALVAMRNTIGPLLRAEEASWTAAQQNHDAPLFTAAQREELLGLLQARDLAAMDRFNQWKPSLVLTMNVADAQIFCAAMQSLKFEQAASLLGAVKTSLSEAAQAQELRS